MSKILTQDSFIDVKKKKKQPFQIFAKSWTPDQLKTDIPIIMFHDSLGSVQLWRDFPEKLAQITGAKVFAYDRLGFGQSSAHPERLAYDFVPYETTHGFKAILDHFQIQDFIAIGHSVGGGIATCCAQQYPERCKALITISAHAIVEALTLVGIREAKAMFQLEGQLDRLKKYHGEKAQWVLDSWTETWLSEEFQDWNLEPILKQVHCPLLVIHGDQDEYGSVEQPKRFIENVAGSSQLHIIQGGHHFPHREQPDLVLSFMNDFLSGLDSLKISA